MFYDNLKAACDVKGIKITPLVAECGGAKGSISNWKKGASPNSDIVISLAMRLNVSTDYLLTGKEKSSIGLTSKQQECLDKFDRLLEIDQGRILERMENIYDSYLPEQKENA